jgi:uncharacterized membrane protein
MSYEAWTFLHLSGVLVFFASFVAAFFWRARAERTEDPRLLAYAYRTLNAADAWLTTPAVAAILAGGVGAALAVGLPVFGTTWVLWSLISFGVSGVVFVLRVLPLQRRLAAQAEDGVRTGRFDLQDHRRKARVWAAWAHLSFVAAAVPVPLMVFKP